MPGFSFKQQNKIDPATNLTDAKVIIYEDGTGNKYTFGLDVSDIFDTFKYEPSSGAGAGTAVDYSALAEEFMKGGVFATLLGKLTTIDTNVGTIGANVSTINSNVGTINTKVGTIESEVGTVKNQTNPIPADLTTRLAALNPADTSGGLGQALEQLGTKVGLVKDKTDNMPDNLKTELAPLTAAAGKITAIETVVGNSPLAPMLTGLESKVDAIKTQTNPIPANLTARLDALDPAVTTGGLGQALKGIQDKTEKLDLTVATGTLGKALSELAKTTELAPLATVAGKVATIEGKASLIPDNLLARLDALNLDALDSADDDPGTLGEALEAIQLETGSMSTDLKLLTALLKGQLGTSSAPAPEPESPQSNSGHTSDENMLGKYSHDQFLG